ncbi:DegT/DnrJ/EryC1/StrS aminotransferase family protein [Cognatishimia sp. MH4019]|uniref:DegT/DnrJ/EryC1/StrS family aminotransferase n=1 Tax=Cognatishimia sp. MH4019 TaxID=2854030 RepID=UPI001CD33889|nr:DegT/DnrJ/EryC1/StrS aminotransferase family protein [Cognatishimia sp. MH4019]
MQFIDLAAQQARLKDKIDARIQAVLAHGKYILGPEVAELEERLSAFCGARHTITCANGTDALLLALMALDIRGGDAVFVPAFTFAATAEVVPCMGAVPIMVDCDPDTFNMDPESLKRCIVMAREMGLTPKVVIPVDLFGLPADYTAIEPIARDEGLTVIADSAQGFGGRIGNKVTGTFGQITTTSFFPAKPLGCYGDGGAIFTDDDNLAELMTSYRFHGKGDYKYDNVRIGMNSRLDTLQAAILLEKLAVYEEEIEARQRVAERYSSALAPRWSVPTVPGRMLSVWAQYTLKAEDRAARDAVMARLKEAGIPSVVYYPMPLHQQTAYKAFPVDPDGLPVSEEVAGQVFSLPMHPYLSEADQDRVIEALLTD